MAVEMGGGGGAGFVAGTSDKSVGHDDQASGPWNRARKTPPGGPRKGPWG